jgi:uncharacterized membrane protein YfcA
VSDPLLALAFGFVVALLTTPVGVSGAVLLLPVQLDVLQVPNPAVTPTNLLYNVVSGPGALLRHRLAGRLDTPLLRQLLAGTVPGVVIGAALRVWLVPDPRPFRIVAALVLLPMGVWLVSRNVRTPPTSTTTPFRPRTLVVLALAVGVVGGVYGIGGGSLLAPLLVGRGLAVAEVAPAALASTFVTSIVGATAFTVLAVGVDGSVAPDWPVGIAAGLGGLVGGYCGARWSRFAPERALRLLLGALAVVLALVYVVLAAR